jgi:phosphoglycerate kinase
VPLVDGQITDDFRIKKTLDTINYLLSKDARIVICSHLGRPEGKVDNSLSLFPIAKHLKTLLHKELEFVTDCVGEKVQKAKSNLKPGEILLLENLRFNPGEEANSAEFAKELAQGVDVFVQDAFAVVHRKHASTSAITQLLPSVAGLLLEKEVDIISGAMQDPERPLTAIVGGAKIVDKIDILERFIAIADVLIVGGAMANTFLRASGIEVGLSLISQEEIPLARDIIRKCDTERKKRNFIFSLPFDGVVSNDMKINLPTRIVDWSTNIIADIEYYPKRPPKLASQIKKNEQILDIGPFSGSFGAGIIQLSKTVIWNGTMGVTEIEGYHHQIGPFAHGTDLIIQAILGDFGHKPFSIVGGGDTVGYIENRHLEEGIDHLSTGGGASLELMSGHSLPGVSDLLDK